MKKIPFFGLGLFLFLFSTNAQAQDCRKLFASGNLVGACKCFVKKAKDLGPGAKLSSDSRVSKGRFLRNGGICFKAVANRERNPSKASELLIQAVDPLELYLSEKLYENSSMKRATEKLLSEVRRQIGFASVTIIASNPGAKICWQNGSKSKCSTGAIWKTKLVPGAYTIRVTYPLKPPVTKSKQVKLSPRTDKTFLFTQPVKKIGLLSVATNDAKTMMYLSGGKLKSPLNHTGLFWTKKLTPGDYLLTIIFPGLKPIKKKIKIVESQTVPVIINKPGPPVLLIHTAPTNARVFIDGKYRGNTGIRLKLKPGTRKIELRKGCFLMFKKELQMAPNKEYNVSEILKRDPVYLDWLKKKREVKKQSKTFAWVMLFGGLALAGGGGAMYGLASGQHATANEWRGFNTKNYNDHAGLGNTFHTLGHVGVGIGAVVAGIGVVSLASGGGPGSQYDLPCKVPMRRSN